MAHRLGIIGYGGMASFHHSFVDEIDGIKTVAVYDIDPERRELAASRGLKVYETAEEFLASDEFDIVLVATPNNFHREYTIAAMKAGKNVICEKPIAIEYEEVEAMIDASEKLGKVFTIHHNRRWDRDFNMVKKVIADGTIGKPFLIESKVVGAGGSLHGWRGHKVAGGGMLLDWGIHLIDQALNLVDSKVEHVYANLGMTRNDQVDDYDDIVIKFENGLVYHIVIGIAFFHGGNRWMVNGQNGSMCIKNWDLDDSNIIQEKEVEIEWAQEIVHTAAGPTRTMSPRPKFTTNELPLPEVKTDVADFYRNVMDAIDGKAELIVRHDEIKRVFKIIEACRKSSELGEVVKLGI